MTETESLLRELVTAQTARAENAERALAEALAMIASLREDAETLRARREKDATRKRGPRNARGNSTESTRKIRGNSVESPRNVHGNSEDEESVAPPSVSLDPHTPINPSTPPGSANAEAASGKSTQRRGTSKPWMGEIRTLWGEVYPGAEPPKGAANILARLEAKHGLTPMLVELRGYLNATPPAYVNLAKFASTYGTWAQGGARTNSTSRANGKGSGAAQRLFEIIRDNGLSAAVPIEDHDRTIDELAARGEVKDAAAVKTALRAVKPWTWFRSIRSGDEAKAVDRIAHALAELAA